MTTTQTLIIGASAAGLATAACLQKTGSEFIILEKAGEPANSWRNHYDRLHLHTSKKWSALPFKHFAKSIPQYPSRLQVIDYLMNYAKTFAIDPVFNTEAISIKRSADSWVTETQSGRFQSKYVVLATGINHTPVIPGFPGQDSFAGKIIHSSAFKNGSVFAGKKVLIVGFGNSACELAICLHEHGAFPSLAVRSAVNVLPRDIFGIPVLELGKFTAALPAKLADFLNAPLIRLMVGDIRKLGLRKSKYGPREQIEKLQRIPLLDIGTIQLIKQGDIKVYGNILRIERNTVHFENQQHDDVDVIIFATGYCHNLEKVLQVDQERIRELTQPFDKQTSFGKDGLYACGFYLSPSGMLREIGIEARKIALDISERQS